MTKHEKTKANVSNGAFSKYVERKQMHQKVTFRIKCDGSTCYVLNGLEMSENQFRELYPIGLIDRSRHTNRADPRQSLIY